MAPADSKIEASASWNFKPLRSQVYLTTLFFGGIAIFSVGLGFLWFEKFASSAIPLLVGLGMIGASVYGWFRSQADVDMHQAAPVNVKVNHDASTELTFDSRMLTGGEGRALALLRVVGTALNRAPLPDPDGLVDVRGVPVPDSTDEARERVRVVNAKTKELDEQVLRRLLPRAEAQLSQPSAPVIIPENTDKISHNVPETSQSGLT